MNSTPPETSIEIDKVSYQIVSIDEFGFLARVDLPAGMRGKGELTLGGDKLAVGFRVRENNANLAKCSFSNLSIAGSEVVRKFLRKRDRGFIEGSLESRSYDELAKGLTGATPKSTPHAHEINKLHATDASVDSRIQPAEPRVLKSKTAASQWKSTPVARADSIGNENAVSSKTLTDTQTTAPQPTAYGSTLSPRPIPQSEVTQPSTAPTNVSSLGALPESDTVDSEPRAANSGVRSLAMMIMMFALIGLLILTFYFLRSRSTLTIGNSALVGNYLPVNVKVEGEIVELLVSEGDTVKKGDVLMRINNPTMQLERDQLGAQLTTAKAKVQALKKRLKTTEKRIVIAGKKLALDLMVAKSEKEVATKFLEVAKLNFDRMKPALDSGAITSTEFEVTRQELLAAEANKTTTENAVKQIEFAVSSVKDNILILGDRFDDESGRLIAELEIAKAEQQEMESALAAASEQFSNMNVTAPRDGTVYVVYRQLGEYVKLADETVGISFEGKVWAAGQVSANQSRRVRPGQPVTISAPSLGRKFEGFVSAVGHRAMYSQGHYTADFRGETATDVPVKVTIQDLPDNIPSGIRLEMAINTGFGVEWLDNTMGYSLRSVSSGKRIDDVPEAEANLKDSNTDEAVIGKIAADM